MRNIIIPFDFDWKIYLKLNTDLKESISNEKDAVYHWYKFGHKEDRLYSKTHVVQKLKKNLKPPIPQRIIPNVNYRIAIFIQLYHFHFI